MTRSFVALLCAAVLSCDWYEKNTVQEISGPVPAGARVKFFNFGVGSPAVNFYAGSRKMTAVVSSSGLESPNGVAYGGVGAGGFYTAIAGGQYTLSGKIADTAAAVHDLAISNVTATLEEGKAYSFYQSGFYNATNRAVDAFIVEDGFIPQFDYTVAYVRFVHAISNASPMTLYARSTTTTDSVTVGAPVAYKSAGAFTPVPPGVYDLRTRYTGVTAAAITRTVDSSVSSRIYTISARGDSTVTSSTATNRPFLDNTTNR